MRLSSLLPALPSFELLHDRAVEITHITSDSRQVTPGALFVAYPGLHVDGARYIPDAVQRGAAAVVTQSPISNLQSLIPNLQSPIPLILVPDARVALAYLAAAWHDWPSRKMRVIGVTGTDGKTTTCTLIASILSAAGYTVGTITTVGATIGGQEVDTGFHTTTPDAPNVQRYLAQMVAAGAEYAVVEATSEGLAQHRLDAVDFDVAVVTNITHEHLYFHKTWENYRDAKAMLFRSLVSSYRKPSTHKVAVLNADDNTRGVFDFLTAIPYDEQVVYSMEDHQPPTADGGPSVVTPPTSIGGQRFDDPARPSGTVVGGQGRIFARNIEHSSRGLRLTVGTPDGDLALESPLIGRFNVSNIVAAVGTTTALRVPVEAIKEGIARVTGIVGRMQVLQHEPFAAIVDFAHTPNALRVALETAREISQGRVIAVFGCAGLRDVDKRAWMGEIAGRLADKTVVTAEDPRTESLAAINAQIAAGLQRAGRREHENYLIIDDRAEAIASAVKMARAGDLVIVCGKGHERSMCFGTTEYPWSDQDALSAALARSL